MQFSRRGFLGTAGAAIIALPKVFPFPKEVIEAESDEYDDWFGTTRLEAFLKSRGIKPALLARESGYSRQHLLRLRLGRIKPAPLCIVALVAALRRLSREPVQADHRDLHQLMYTVEDDGDVQIAWCGYLWQRAFTFMAWQGQWYLVVALARQLLEHRTLTGAKTERFLRIAATRLERDPIMPNCVLIGEVRNIASPFHHDWIEKSWRTPLPKRLLEVPSSLAGLSAQADAD